MKLALGLIPPDRGRIAFDQADIADLQLDALRRQCGVMMQETRLFAGSILDNIVAGRDLALDQVLAALDQVGLGDFVRSLPMGVHTVVGEGSPAFSGGQAQLMSLARALAGGPKILIVDEPTSALDTASLNRVSETLRSLPITRIVLTHRLGTLKD
jgi:ABC-type bacteriocin/lantibiotic exporter with double-glycine peptidase domain